MLRQNQPQLAAGARPYCRPRGPTNLASSRCRNWYRYRTCRVRGASGRCSPTLSNIALNGLEKCAQECTAHMVSRRERTKVYLIRYADDFIVSGASREILDTARSGIEAFLEPRGLRLHPGKTRVVEINRAICISRLRVLQEAFKLLERDW